MYHTQWFHSAPFFTLGTNRAFAGTNKLGAVWIAQSVAGINLLLALEDLMDLFS